MYLYRAGSTQHPGHYTANYTAIRASKGDAEPTSSPPAFLSHCEGAHQLQNLETALKAINTSVPFYTINNSVTSVIVYPADGKLQKSHGHLYTFDKVSLCHY